MSKKKISLIILLIAIIAVVVFVVVNSNQKQEKKVASTNTVVGEERSTESEQPTNNETSSSKEIKVTELSDGTLYSTTDEEIKPDMVVGDNYFDTTIADLNLNFSKYEGKTIEIEGLYISNNPYTFVGRYSTSNLCPDCPAGYSYFEYELKGDNVPQLKEEEDWIKVKGTLKKAYDASISSDYYYIDVASLEVMNEKGQDTVSN